jgi:NADH-quinone oxidoreductase subunit H
VFFLLAPAVAVGTALLATTVVPFGPTTAPPPPAVTVDGQSAVQVYEEAQTAYRDTFSWVIAPGLDIGILFTFSLGSLAVYGVILAGWSANNKYTLLGSLRSSAQIISYEIPLGMSIVGVVLVTGSLNLETMVDRQARHGWNVLYQPLAFLLFMISVYAECNRLPFDLPEAEQELVGGYHTEYSNSMKLGLMLMAEYVHMVTTSLLMTVVFWGGWSFPGLDGIGGTAGVGVKVLVLMAKMGVFLMLYLLVRWTIPRFRFDQLMGLAWKVMIPLSLLNLVCVMLALEFGVSQWVLTGASVVLLLGAVFVSTRMPKTPQVRRRPAHVPALAPGVGVGVGS